MGLGARFNANTDKWRRTTSLPSAATMSWCAWIYLAVDINNFATVWYRTANSNPPYAYLGTGGDGTTIHLSVGDNGSVNTSADGTNLSIGTWYHLAYTVASGVHRAYVNGVLDATVTPPNAFTPSNDEITFGHDDDTDNDFLNGRIAGLKIWDGVALSADELLREMQSIQPVRLANLYGWIPFPDGKDHSGNARDFTVSGTVDEEDGPPVSWGGPVLEVPAAAGTSSVTGDVALTGSGGALAAAGEPVITATVALSGSGGTLAVAGGPVITGTVALNGSGGTFSALSNSVTADVALAGSGGSLCAKESRFPLSKVTPGGSMPPYFVDRLGVPFRPQTDTWFTLQAHFSLDEIRIILDQLVALGYSGLRMMLEVHAGTTFGDQRNEPNDYDNNPPFTTAGHFDTPGAAYTNRTRIILAMCGERDLLVWLEIKYLGFPSSGQGWEAEVDDAHNTNLICFNHGVYIETNYGCFPNVQWSACGDQVPTGTRLTKTNQMIAGIESVRTSHILVGELDEPDDHFPADVAGLTTVMATGDSWYGIGLAQNGRTEETADESVLAGEANGPYEIALLQNTWNAWKDREDVRMLYHRGIVGGGWAMSNSGDDASFEGSDARFGGVFGLATIYPTPSANKLDQSYANAFYLSFPWWRMRPSGTTTNHCGRTLIASSNAAGDSHIVASMTDNGTVLVAYVSTLGSTSTAAVTFTVDLRSMVGGSNGLRARWWNPTTGAYSTNGSAAGTYSLDNTASAQSFTTPGSNGTMGDWMLVIDGGGLVALAGSGGSLAANGQSTVTGDVAITGSGGSLAATGGQVITGDVAIASSGGTLAAQGGPIILGSVALDGSGGTLAAAGQPIITGTLGLTGAGGTIHVIENGANVSTAGYRSIYQRGSGYRTLYRGGV